MNPDPQAAIPSRRARTSSRATAGRPNAFCFICMAFMSATSANPRAQASGAAQLRAPRYPLGEGQKAMTRERQANEILKAHRAAAEVAKARKLSPAFDAQCRAREAEEARAARAAREAEIASWSTGKQLRHPGVNVAKIAGRHLWTLLKFIAVLAAIVACVWLVWLVVLFAILLFAAAASGPPTLPQFLLVCHPETPVVVFVFRTQFRESGGKCFAPFPKACVWVGARSLKTRDLVIYPPYPLCYKQLAQITT